MYVCIYILFYSFKNQVSKVKGQLNSSIVTKKLATFHFQSCLFLNIRQSQRSIEFFASRKRTYTNVSFSAAPILQHQTRESRQTDSELA